MTTMLRPFPYTHEGTEGETIAGWGVWHDGWQDALIYDGFASEAQAQAAITKLPDNPSSGAEVWGSFGGDSEEWFLSTLGHGWTKAECPQDCITCAYDRAAIAAIAADTNKES